MSRSRTPERIAEAALQLFNCYGEPNVTTNRIADELEISPGNLHYHFKTKQSLIDELFGRYEQRMLELLGGDGFEHADVEDAWLFLHLVFENIAAYRFIYRDLNELCAKSRDLAEMALNTPTLKMPGCFCTWCSKTLPPTGSYIET